MVNPVDVQTFVVRAVDAAQNVNQVQNAPYAAQHTGLLENIQRAEQERNMVQAQQAIQQKNVQNSLEGSNRGFYAPAFRRRAAPRENKKHVRDEKRGLILDVRL